MNKELIGDIWYEKLSNEFQKDYFKKILNDISISVSKHHKILPSSKEVFKSFKECDYCDVSVVMLLKFPIVDGLKQPVMDYINKTIEETCYNDLYLNFQDSLEYLYSQRVLVLPLFHTVNMNDKSNIFREWGNFTRQVIKHLKNHSDRLVFIVEDGSTEIQNLLSFETFINTKDYHTILNLSDKQCFNKTNELLIKYGRKKIEW